MTERRTPLAVLAICGSIAAAVYGVEISARQDASPAAQASAPATPAPTKAMLDRYCIGCHNDKARAGGLSLSTMDPSKPAADAEVWEASSRSFIGHDAAAGQAASRRADLSSARRTCSRPSSTAAWAANPNPGRISAVHRLNRTEYNNAIRDLFALDLDVKSLLPGDETADGSFDNFADVAYDLDGAPGAIPVGGPPGDAARDRSAARQPGARDVRDSAAHRAGRSAERRSAVRLSRRHRRSPQLSRRRRVPHQGPSAAAVPGLHHGHGLAAAARRSARRQAAEAVHRRRWSARAGRPRASYAGDGEPGFAGDPEWEEYMQVSGDAGLEVRVPVEAGPRMSSASRSSASCGSPKGCRSRCSAAAC